jgi:RES domain-containing protein
VEVYRIGSARFPIFDGSGASASDAARWNSRGRQIIYAAEHYATALLEKSAQLSSVRLPRSLQFVSVRIPDAATIEEVRGPDLPGWDADDRMVSQSFGNRWYDEARSLILLVPSLAAPGLERNVLINQRHPQFRRLKPGAPRPIACHPKLLV